MHDLLLTFFIPRQLNRNNPFFNIDKHKFINNIFHSTPIEQKKTQFLISLNDVTEDTTNKMFFCIVESFLLAKNCESITKMVIV